MPLVGLSSIKNYEVRERNRFRQPLRRWQLVKVTI
ncbi:MAG: hypothetical protein GPOALKHO_000456 [Sodalis sp.]|nr:MAG: hypothetical protein GPOALKHO_000456 [Sodalis sp.]